MTHKEYIAISETIADQLNKHLEKFCKKNPTFEYLLNQYTKKRIHLNGIQFYMGFKAANTAKKFENFLDIPIVLEYIMIMAYETNRILDHKQEIWRDEEKIKETVLNERMCFVLILKLLENSKKNLGDKYNFIRDLILEIIYEINEGFWFEKTFLNVNFSPLNIIIKDWDEKYKKRNILFNRIYDYTPLLGYYIASGNKSIFKKYEKYFINKLKFSHLGQIINDLSDYSLIFDENVKSYQDIFSDIKNGIITQPTFELIKEKTILNALKNPALTKNKNWRTKALKLIIKNNIVKKIQKMTTKGYSQNINFWKKIMRIDNSGLFYTYSLLLKRNKYYQYYESLETKLQ